MKKLFTFLLAVVAGIGMMNAEVYSGSCGYNLTWELNTADSTLVISGNGTMNNYTYSFDAPWSRYKDYIAYIVIAEGVTSIGSSAFEFCSNLISVSISKTVTSIKSEAFYFCPCPLMIPNTVTIIERNAFYNVPYIIYSGSASGSPWGARCVNGYIEGDLVYSNDTKQELVYCSKEAQGVISIPNTVTAINDYAFSNCKKITKIIIPESVTYIEDRFQGCINLQSIEVDIKNTNYRAIDGILYRCYEGEVFEIRKMPSKYVGDYIMPKTVVVFGCFSIMDVPGLTSIILSPALVEWCEPRFETCENLRNVVFSCRDTIYPYQREMFPSTCTITRTEGYTIYLSDTTVCPGEFVNGEPVYYSGERSVTYTASNGCDSIVIQNVIVKKPLQPYVMVQNVEDTVQLGAIYLYDAYTYAYNEYSEDTTLADYDYITVNGVRYDHAASHDVSQVYNTYYEADNSGVQPSFKIENLPVGDYQISFYNNECNAEYSYWVNINQYAICIDGIYYDFNDESQQATVTYRGMSYNDYDEYSGDIVIPEKVKYKGKEYDVTRIGSYAFAGSPHITSVVVPNSVTRIGNYAFCHYSYGSYSDVKTISIGNGIQYLGDDPFNNCKYLETVHIGAATPPDNAKELFENTPQDMVIYVPFGSTAAYKALYSWRNLNIQADYQKEITVSSTSCVAEFTLDIDLASCALEGGEEFGGNKLVLTGLEPNTEYPDNIVILTANTGVKESFNLSFKTEEMNLKTLKSRAVSSTTAILLAETNMSDAEISCGFEYKRNDAPADMEGTSVYCPVASGTMAGRLKNLKDDVYYKYRAFYQSANGNMYYGDWKYIFTGDVTVEFDPVLYTYDAVAVTESKATLKGYAIAGAEDFTEQGFEYWADSRVPQANNAPARMLAELGEHKTVQATGIKMQVTLTDLDAGTVYKYRTYAKVGDQVCYGAEMTFTTQGVYKEEEGIDLIPATLNTTSRKILYNGQIFILRGDKIYTITGQKVK